MGDKIRWDVIFRRLKTALVASPLPSVSWIAEKEGNPYRVLVSTMISLRTKDEVTLQAATRLFTEAPDPAALAALPASRISELIYPAGFYKTKAENLKRTAEILVQKHRSGVPATIQELLELPGVGRKTANLVLNLGYGIKAICVDTHVHRISNRTGWVVTRTPEETEQALMKILPEKHWIEINEWLVRFGQQICRPASPFCSRCPIPEHCQRVGVVRSR